MTAAVAALLKAAEEADPQIRSAAMRRLGELAGPAELPALLDMLLRGHQPQDLGAVEEAVSGVLARLRASGARTPTSSPRCLAQAQPAPKGSLLRILGSIGGAGALKAVRAVGRRPQR